MQTQKKECQDQMESLQEWEAEIIAQAEDTKKKMAQTQVEWEVMISDENAVHVLNALREKTT
jgi:hypothetical protein